ncbi:CDP-archaeol synthase [Luteolibacter sp. LG18]|uniref:phosphatidate cytidylyltransferase n=1 Tax=Luteolibacter sp. LG18 TaxID=2819286 RepID=UPI002B2DE000|nr:phosphatidate cytidylyltransferase [Luteolibacter sp. LG18]
MADSTPPPAPSKGRTFVRRAASTIGLWAVVGAAFASRWAWAYFALIAVLAILSTIEYFNMVRAAGVKCFPRFGILLSIVYTLALGWYFIFPQPPGSFGGRELPDGLDTLAIFIATAGAFTLQLRYSIKGIEALQAVALNVLGFVYVAVLFHFAARLVFVVPGDGQVPGAVLLLWVIAVTKFTDMGAYLTGTMIGRHKMIPHVSPGKTWEGFVGALFFAQLAGCGLHALCPHDLAILGGWPHVVALGFILALLAVVGDLAESVLKRSLNAKDSGHMLPGIGGALDLIDSICFTAPALFFYLKWVLH